MKSEEKPGGTDSGRIWSLVLILACLGALKLYYNPGFSRFSYDANTYYELSQNLVQGKGYTSKMSLFYQGFKQLPHEVTVQPVWPLVLAMVGAVTGMSFAAWVLPEVLYLLALLLIFFLSDQLFKLSQRRAYSINPGRFSFDLSHLFVLLLGLNPHFFFYTSVPNTEGLAFILMTSLLFILKKSLTNDNWIYSIFAGAVVAASYLARSQYVLLLILPLLILPFSTVRPRRFFVWCAAYFSGVALLILPWLYYIVSVTGEFKLELLINFAAYRETPEISPSYATPLSVWGREDLFNQVLIRLKGLLVAFSPVDPQSYFSLWGPLPLFLLSFVMLIGFRKEMRAYLISHKLLLLTMIVGAATTLPLHGVYGGCVWQWLFAQRHALSLFYMLIGAASLTCAFPNRLVRRASKIVLVFSMLIFCGGTIREIIRLPELALSAAEQEAADFLGGSEGQVRVVSTLPTLYSVLTPENIGFDYVCCRDEPRQLRAFACILDADFLLIYQDERGCPIARELKEVEPLAQFGKGEGKVLVFDLKAEQEIWCIEDRIQSDG